MDVKREDVIGKVQHAIALDPLLDAPKIRISMVGESLLLSGMVENPEQVQRAEQIAREQAPGVALDNGLTVALNEHKVNDGKLNDAALEAVARAQDQIRDRPSSVSAEVVNGALHLRGSCATVADRLFLIEQAGLVQGIRRVIADDLEVAAFGTADDIRLGNLAEERLNEVDPALGDAVGVTVKDRAATLTGRVRASADKQRAEWLVARTPGIKHVRNAIKVYMAGEDLEGEPLVRKEILHRLGDAGLPMPTLHVFVARGTAFLDGEVTTIEQKEAADRIARACPGVESVSNSITVTSRYSKAPTPDSRLK